MEKTMKLKDETINDSFEESYLIYFEISSFEQNKVLIERYIYKKGQDYKDLVR